MVKLEGYVPLSIFETPNKDRVPQRVHLRPSSVQDLGEIFVDLCGAESMSVLCSKFIYHKLVQHVLDVLKVGHVSTSANNGVIAYGMKTLDIFESGKRAVRC